jgi:hypothetical protein
MNQLRFKKLTSVICYLLLGLLLLNIPLNQAVLCMESDGHSNIEYSVVGSCEKSLCQQSQSNGTPDNHIDNCENCTDISLSQNSIVSKGDIQSIVPDSSFLQIAWVLDTFSFDYSEPIAQHWDNSYLKVHFQNSSLAHRQTIVLII